MESTSAPHEARDDERGLESGRRRAVEAKAGSHRPVTARGGRAQPPPTVARTERMRPGLSPPPRNSFASKLWAVFVSDSDRSAATLAGTPIRRSAYSAWQSVRSALHARASAAAVAG